MKKDEHLTDEEVVRRLRNGDGELEDYLINKYKGMVLEQAHAMFLIGGEQEGMIRLFKAVRDYQPDKNASFSTFANLCVGRQMYTAIEISGRQKHRPLNTYISLSEEDGPLRDTEDIMQQNPEAIVIGRENASALLARIQKLLNPFEKQVLDAYLESSDYIQIVEKIGKTPKSIDNALQRIRGKNNGMKQQ